MLQKDLNLWNISANYLQKKNRKYAPPTFMPNGLYLTNIKYDEKWKFPISNNKVNILSTNDD